MFEIWKKEIAHKGYLCAHGQIDGGPGWYGFSGCNHPSHGDITWCHDEKNCPDFEMRSEKGLYSLFYHDYRENCKRWNQDYDISPDDDEYLYDYYNHEPPKPVEKPPEIKLVSIAKRSDDKFYCCECGKEVKFLCVFCESCGITLDWKDVASQMDTSELNRIIYDC